MTFLLFVILQREKRVKPLNQAIDIIWSGKDPPGFYSRVVDHVIGKSCKSHTLYCHKSVKHAFIIKICMIFRLWLIK